MAYVLATRPRARAVAPESERTRLPRPRRSSDRAHAAAGLQGSAHALPHLERIQEAFGKHDVRGIRAFVGGPAVTASDLLGASAYTVGDAVAFRGAPDLHTVVQQRAGVHLAGGVGQDGDPYERHADAVAARVLQGASAEALLDRHAARRGATHAALQRKERRTYWGTFDDVEYKKIEEDSKEKLSIRIEFTPNDRVDAKKVGLTQAVKDVFGGKPQAFSPTGRQRSVQSGPEAGASIDRIMDRTNPIYGAGPVTSGDLADTAETTPATHEPTYQLGLPKSEERTKRTAWMADKPSNDGTPNRTVRFETTALALEGAQAGTYYGSVTWGFETDASGAMKEREFVVASEGAPTQMFLQAAKAWNESRALGTVKTVRDTVLRDVKDDKLGDVPAGRIAKRLETASSSTGEHQMHLSIITGSDEEPHPPQEGYIKVSDLQDMGDGLANTPLPLASVYTLTDALDLDYGIKDPLRLPSRAAAGTRVVVVRRPLGLLGTKVIIRIIQGPHAGAEREIDTANLKPEGE